ncbi:MAG: hypothetical protein P8Z36_00310 [Gemmatimonadota bacterium]
MLPKRTRTLLGMAGVVCYLCYVSAYLPGTHHCIEDTLVVQYFPASTHHPAPGDDHDDDACHCIGPCTADVVVLVPSGTPPAPRVDLLPVPPVGPNPRRATPTVVLPHRQPPANAPPRLA